MARVARGGKAHTAMGGARAKGSDAESGDMPVPLGSTDNIRRTVAIFMAERYVAILWRGTRAACRERRRVMSYNARERAFLFCGIKMPELQPRCGKYINQKRRNRKNEREKDSVYRRRYGADHAV